MKADWCVEETDGHWRCGLCPHGCLLKAGQDGLCGVRGVRDGQAVALGYGQVSARHLDPIEKKPLYHFYPGTKILSIGGWGCNFRCRHCQNCQMSLPATSAQVLLEAREVALPHLPHVYIGNVPLGR